MARLSHALVLTAGLGTRLDPLTRVRAKPAVPVAGEALVRRIIRGLVAQSVTNLVLNLHHLPATIAAVVGDGRDLGAAVRYSWEQPANPRQRRGTRTCPPPHRCLDVCHRQRRHAVERRPGRSCLGASSAGALVTLAVTPNREPDKYGGVRMNAGGEVTGFVPRGTAAAGSFHFVGVQIVEAEVFRTVPPGVPRAVIGGGRPGTENAGVYDDLILHQQGRVRGVVSETTFRDVGTIADYFATCLSLSDTPADRVVAGRGGVIDPSATVTRSILWDDVKVGPGVVSTAALSIGPKWTN